MHQLVKGRKLIIGGVDIPNETGLSGHSDADVLLHAIMDSILGAAASGDIGKHFPDNDITYKNADSMLLLKKVYDLIKENGWKIGNIDATVIAQSPKLSPFIETMRQNISQTLECEISQINIKATTEEHLGFTGQKLGISAHSVCLIWD